MYYITLHLKGEMLEEYSSAGFNTYVMEWMNAQGYADMARRVEEYGLVPIVGIQNMAGSHAYDSSRDYSRRGMLEGRLPVGRMGVSTVSRDAGHNVLAYYTRDEPNELMYDLLKGLHEIVREVDPYHPSMTVIYTAHLFPAYHSATDVLGPDIYPSFPGGSIARVGESMAKARREMLGKPVFAVLQSFYDGDRRMPNRAELRCMTYLSIVNGVTGILYFSYDYNGPMKERHPEAWEALKELAGEARALAPVFLSEPPSGLTLETTGSDDVDAKVFRHDGAVYVVAVNREDRGPASVAFALRGETGVRGDVGPVDVLFEDRRVATDGDVWTDDFGAYDVHVYKLGE
jgi:hypothetical protein